jgi:hypothetical protein
VGGGSGGGGGGGHFLARYIRSEMLPPPPRLPAIFIFSILPRSPLLDFGGRGRPRTAKDRQPTHRRGGDPRGRRRPSTKTK